MAVFESTRNLREDSEEEDAWERVGMGLRTYLYDSNKSFLTMSREEQGYNVVALGETH